MSSTVFLYDANGASDERGLWDIWTQHNEGPTNHAALATACANYSKGNRTDVLSGVADTLGAWHYLKMGSTVEAYKAMLRYTKKSMSPMGRATGKISAAWLTRVDRDHVRQVLQFYYRKEIAYPENLQILADYKKLPKSYAFRLKDRWGKDWSYRLVGFTKLPGMLNQKYKIQSTRLGLGSDLTESLKRPYADKIRIKPLRIQKGSRQGSEFIEVAIGGEGDGDDIAAGPTTVPKGAKKEVLGAGTEKQGILLAYVGKKILVFADKDHWMILPKPRK